MELLDATLELATLLMVLVAGCGATLQRLRLGASVSSVRVTTPRTQGVEDVPQDARLLRREHIITLLEAGKGMLHHTHTHTASVTVSPNGRPFSANTDGTTQRETVSCCFASYVRWRVISTYAALDLSLCSGGLRALRSVGCYFVIIDRLAAHSTAPGRLDGTGPFDPLTEALACRPWGRKEADKYNGIMSPPRNEDGCQRWKTHTHTCAHVGTHL